MNVTESIKDNSRILIAGILIYVAAADYGLVTPVWEIDGAGIVITAGAVIGAAGYVGADYVMKLLPDEEGIYLVAFEASDDTGGSLWEISEDQFDDMDVHAGTLFEWPGTSKRVYEVKEYHPEENKAIANWRESVAGSQLAGNSQLVHAFEQIAELRNEFEPEAQKSRYLQRRIRSIVRRQDRERLRDQQDVLDPTVAPTFDESRKTVSEIVDEEIPDELQPDTIEENGQAEPESIGFEILDDSEALEQDRE